MPTPWPPRPSTRCPGTSTTTWPSWWSSPRRRARLDRARVPRRADHGVRGPAAGRPDVRSWGMDAEQAELACLLVSEVVTNAVLHASITPSPGRGLDLDLDPVIMPPGRRAPDRSRSPPTREAPAPGGARAGWETAGWEDGGGWTPPDRAPRSSRCACGGARPRCGSRSSIPTSGCPGSAPPGKPTRAGAACTWSSSSRPGGDPGRPRRQGGLVRDAAQRPPALRRGLRPA
jgi:hypothetical protein